MRGAGSFQTRIAFERDVSIAAPTVDAAGTRIEDWRVLGYRWAARAEPSPRDERTAGEPAVRTERSIELIVRSDRLTRSITTRDRIDLTGRKLGIVSVDAIDERREEIRLVCRDVS